MLFRGGCRRWSAGRVACGKAGVQRTAHGGEIGEIEILQAQRQGAEASGAAQNLQLVLLGLSALCHQIERFVEDLLAHFDFRGDRHFPDVGADATELLAAREADSNDGQADDNEQRPHGSEHALPLPLKCVY